MTSTAPTMETLFQSGSGQEGISSSIINYLGNDAKIELACTCSSMQDQVTNGNGIAIQIDPIIWGSPSDHNTDDSDRGDRFLQNMHAHLQDERKKNILRNHHYRVKIEQVHQFGVNPAFNAVTVAQEREFIRKLNEKTAKMRSITELDISLPTPRDLVAFVFQLLTMFPNLRKINLTNILLGSMDLVAKYCPHLETIIWNHTDAIPSIVASADGDCFAPFHNLKEITLDNRYFYIKSQFRASMADTTNNNVFLFHHCVSNNPMLARVSMKNVTDYHSNKTLPQRVLMKFVRNVPSLTYFRSDLTPENIAILQLERPEMVFE